MTFKEGGAYDFHSTYERIRERLLHAVEVARETGQLTGEEGGDFVGVNMDSVHLDELPAYEDAHASAPLLSHRFEAPRPPAAPQSTNPPPSEPPGYEEVQRESVADELERRLRNQA
jgi:WW domain-binding protein 2